MDAQEPANKKPPRVVGIAGGLLGLLVGRYAGLALLIPLGASFGIYAIARKFVKGTREIILPAFSVQAGHLVWFCVGMLATQQFGSNLLDVVVFGIGLTWLIRSPSKRPLLVLNVFQALALVINGVAISEVEWGTAAHRALTVHIIFRAVAIALNVMAIRKLQAPGSPAHLAGAAVT